MPGQTGWKRCQDAPDAEKASGAFHVGQKACEIRLSGRRRLPHTFMRVGKMGAHS